MRKHINLFVRDTIRGVFFSSVVHEWANGKYDSVTVEYLDYEDLGRRMHDLLKRIRVADYLSVNPCSERRIIVIGMKVPSGICNELDEMKNIICEEHDRILLDIDRWTRDVFKHFLGWRTSKWPYGYRALYDAIPTLNWRDELPYLRQVLGEQELEQLISAYLHDLHPPRTFNPYELRDYYFDVFKEKKNASDQTECV